VTASADEFEAAAGDLLASRVEHNLMATVFELAGRLSDGAGADPLFAYVEDDDGAVVAAALRTPPRGMLPSVMDAATADALMAEWLERDPGVPGVVAPVEVARRLAGRWQQLTGGSVVLTMSEAMHTLERVTAPARPASGSLRTATGDDTELLVAWMGDFQREAGLEGPVNAATVERRIERRLLHIWEHERPVAFLGHQPAVAGVVRIGPVYTPPELRSRGYATSAVAAVSRLALDRGARRCALFTDLANPTSNRIYAAVGYRRIADWEDLAFTPGGAESATQLTS
jgi:predicted GNAT family acetyltransferase